MGIDAKASAQGKEVEAATKISAAMFCENHNRLCYLTINGTCAVYGPTMLKEHSIMLVSTSVVSYSTPELRRFEGSR